VRSRDESNAARGCVVGMLQGKEEGELLIHVSLHTSAGDDVGGDADEAEVKSIVTSIQRGEKDIRSLLGRKIFAKV
jgi:hypothetical protein